MEGWLGIGCSIGWIIALMVSVIKRDVIVSTGRVDWANGD